MHGVRIALLAGVSALAIAAANPETVQAADIPSRPALATKAPPATFRDRWSWWVEGGASALGGDPGVAGLTNFDIVPQRWGWEAAIGVEYRPGMSPWIWSAQFRYGQHGSNSASNSPTATFLVGNFATTPFNFTGANSASRKEHHWAADFMVGRDMGLGQGRTTARFGVRIAQIWGKTNGSAQWQFNALTPTLPCTAAPPSAYCAFEQRDYVQKSTFLGVGPRIALDGQVPFGNNWAFEYAGGVAVLFGRRKADQTVAINQIAPTAIPTPVCVTGCPVATSSSSNNGVVFNLDAMLGFSYAVTQNMSLLVSYRFDGYWNALRGYDSNGNVTNLNRFYHGPMLRLTVTN
jgi:opacity protein-like surface antigen